MGRMASPENSPLPRPASIPTDARWDPRQAGFEWVHGALDDTGEKHGPYRSWTKDGVLHGASTYEHGKLHGTNTNYHPDGSVSSEGAWRAGVLYDCTYFKCQAPSTEPWPAEAGANVASVRYYSRDGKTNYTIRYFTKDNVEVASTGADLPVRPPNVSADARWFPSQSRWVDGAIERRTNLQLGLWRWWSEGGVLRHEEHRDFKGTVSLIARYEADGAIERKTAKSDAGEDDEWFRAGGERSALYRKDARGRKTYEAHWMRDGTLREETSAVYAGDHLASVTERGEAGVLVFEARREGPAMACVLYADGGKVIAASGLVRDAKLAGVWRIFDDAGAVRREVDTTPYDIKHTPTAEGLHYRLGQALYRHDEPTLPTPEQLAGVDDEAWVDLAGCYTDRVKEFPRLLRALVSPDPFVRQYALGVIDGETEHQGSTYPATAHVIPWLARLLSHPKVDRSRLLSMIQVAGEAAAPYVDQVQELPEDDVDRIGIEGTYRAAAAAWPQIWALFPVASADDRRRILVIAKFAPEAKPDVLALARTDPDAGMRACAVDSLTSMPDYDVADVVPALRDPDPLVRTATAIAIACTRGPETPAEVAPVIADGLRTWREISSRFGDLPYTDGHIVAYLALAAGSMRSLETRALAAPLCAAIDEVDGISATMLGQGLCALAFGSGDLPFAPGFVDILDTLAHSRKFWVFNVNASEILRKWNLPSDPEPLAALVTDLRSSADPESLMYGRMHAGVDATHDES
jgi:hypothetical protein